MNIARAAPAFSEFAVASFWGDDVSERYAFTFSRPLILCQGGRGSLEGAAAGPGWQNRSLLGWHMAGSAVACTAAFRLVSEAALPGSEGL